VVTVTRAHQMASSAVFILLSGAFSTIRIDMDEKITTSSVMTNAAVKVPFILF
jgi:hypothetical protein